MDSYEKSLKRKIEKGEELPSRIDISMLKYLWQSGPFSSAKKFNIPKFLKKVKIFQNFNDNELRILSKFLHIRTFMDKETIFSQSDLGIGFYLINAGHVEVTIKNNETDEESESDPSKVRTVISLERFDYFGELALLQENRVRAATVIAKGPCELFGIFKPDVEELIQAYPIVAAKLLQSISVIVAERLFSLTKEIGILKYKIFKLEEANEKAKATE